MTRRLLPLAALLLAAVAAPAAAQVGHLPDQSPFVDIEYRQSLTTSVGYFFAPSDPAGVAPQAGPLARIQYDIYLGGPASFTARLGTALLDRNVIDPARPAATRLLGVERRPLTTMDIGFSFALTGAKSYHGFVPLIHTGFGLVSNLTGADPGGLSIGTRFAFAYGAGLRYVSRSRWAVRADLGSHFYQLRYPDRYFQTALDSTSVLPAGASKSRWLNNPAVTVGLSYQLFR
ncbi:MAG: hypothetical protein JO180_00595 [Gemmatirosa sp.]|nr:hypothetical protein [Gemmatirosa sp.]